MNAERDAITGVLSEYSTEQDRPTVGWLEAILQHKTLFHAFAAICCLVVGLWILRSVLRIGLLLMGSRRSSDNNNPYGDAAVDHSITVSDEFDEF